MRTVNVIRADPSDCSDVRAILTTELTRTQNGQLWYSRAEIASMEHFLDAMDECRVEPAPNDEEGPDA